MKNLKSPLYGAACALAFGFISIPSHAELTEVFGSPYNLVYDDVLDVTWAQPKNTNFGTVDDARTYAAELDILGFDDWRLPWISVAAGEGPLSFPDNPVNCAQASEVECRDNELGYMFYHNLGGTFGESILDSGDPNLELFDLSVTLPYWSGTEDVDPLAWGFRFDNGSMTSNIFGAYAWAVHDGNLSAVPLPAAVWLFGSALGLLGWMKRRAA